MPLYRKRPSRKSKKPVYRRRRQFGGYRRKARGSTTSQVFSETYKCSTECAGVNSQGEVVIAAGTGGQGVKFLTQMVGFTQVGNYRNLWSAYKIIKAKFTIIPKWRGETYNEAALGTAAAIGITETPRFAYSINDMEQDLNAPASEAFVLQDNGCRVRMFTKPVSITIRPKPLLEQTSLSVPGLPSVNVYQNRGQWIEFDDAGSNVKHIGIDG